MLNICMFLYNRKGKEMEEETCNPVSAIWEGQGAEETYPGAEPRILLRAVLLRVPALPCTQCHMNIPVHPMRLPGTWWGKQQEQLESSSSPHWQHFQHCRQLLLELYHWYFNGKCPETRRDFARPFQQHWGRICIWDKCDFCLSYSWSQHFAGKHP